MTLTDLASIGSFASAVAVMISLVYLSLQVKQAEKNQRALMQQGRADRVTNSCLRIAEPAMSSVFNRAARGDADLSPEELDQFMNICRSGFVSAEDSFLQHLSGQLDTSAFKSFTAGARNIFSQPGMRVAWRMSSEQYGEEYMRFMNELLEETAVVPPTDRLARWKRMVEAEKGGSA